MSSQQNDILAENLYAEIDESRVDEHLPVQTPYVHPVNDTGEYSHLPEPSISEQKPGGGEVSFITDSSGYSHVIMKNEKSKLDQPEPTLPKTTDTYAIPYDHSITKENTDSDVHVTSGKEGQNVYNVLENTGSDMEQQNVYNVLDNVASGEANMDNEQQNIYNVLDNATSGETAVDKKEQNVYNVLENANLN